MDFLHTHAAVNLALASVLWTVQLVIYPAFRFIEPLHFPQWHTRYTGAITWIVAPLILTQTTGVAGRLFLLPAPDKLWAVEFFFTALAWTVTFAVSVPIHNRLQKARDEKAMRALVLTNWVRTASWSATAVCSWIATGQA